MKPIVLDDEWASKGLEVWESEWGERVVEAMKIEVRPDARTIFRLRDCRGPIRLSLIQSAARVFIERALGALPVQLYDGRWVLMRWSPMTGGFEPCGDFASYDEALLCEVARLLHVPEKAKPAVPDRTGECWASDFGLHAVFRITGPALLGKHPNECIFAAGIAGVPPEVDEIPFTEKMLERKPWLRVPPMPACPEDKELTGIVMCPTEGDKIVLAHSVGALAFVTVLGNWGVMDGDDPWGTRRWGWKLKAKPAVLSPDRVGQWLVSPNGLPFGPIHHSESGVHYLLPGNHGRHLHEGEIGPGKFEPALNTVRMTDKQYCEWKIRERERLEKLEGDRA